MKEIRKLSTILFADIKGYTDLMHSNEAEAMEYLQVFKTILNKKVPKYKGKIIQYFGDACLLSFDSATSGVKCAIALQQDFQENKLPIRIGMHLGEVVFTDDNVFGDGVNIASRIESMGIPGSVLISNSIRNQIKNKSEFGLVSLGSFEFKNVAEPIVVFALDNIGLSVPVKSKIQGKFKEPIKKSKNIFWFLVLISLLLVTIFTVNYFTKDKGETKEIASIDISRNSIAVLPLINLNSKNEDFDYFSDGVTQEIIDELAKINSIVVPAFSTTYHYKNMGKSHLEIAKELGVQYLISGSSRVFDNNDRVKLAIELIDPFTNTRIWNTTFDEELSDAPSIQLAIAKKITEKLNIKLTNSEVKELETPKTTSGEAFRLYLQAKAEINKLSPEGFKNGTRYLEAAIKIDSNYVQAHTLLAWRYAVGGSADLLPGARSTIETVSLASPIIEKAITLDPNISDIYLVRGNLKLYSQNKVSEAKKDIDLALSINSWPRIPTNYCICTAVSVYIALNDVARAREIAELAKKIDPGHALFDWDLGNIAMLDNDYKQSQFHYNESVQKADIPFFNSFLGWSYYQDGKYEEALHYLNKAYENATLPSRFTVAALANTYLKMNDSDNSDKYLQELLNRVAGGEHHLNLFIASIFLERGNVNKSLDYLERGIEESDFGFAVFLRLIPSFKKIEKEPRFQKILSMMESPGIQIE